LWRVRLGPFPGGKEASSALEKAKAAGYSDARIQRAD
jgi:rare lipoprotein A